MTFSATAEIAAGSAISTMEPMLSVSVACRVTILIGAILLPVLLTSCGKKGQDGGTVAGEEKTAHGNEGDFLDKDAKPDERKYLVAAKPFFIAIANEQYAEA